MIKNRVNRLVAKGEVFVAMGRDVSELVALLDEAEISYEVRHHFQGWVVALA